MNDLLPTQAVVSRPQNTLASLPTFVRNLGKLNLPIIGKVNSFAPLILGSIIIATIVLSAIRIIWSINEKMKKASSDLKKITKELDEIKKSDNETDKSVQKLKENLNQDSKDIQKLKDNFNQDSKDIQQVNQLMQKVKKAVQETEIKIQKLNDGMDELQVEIEKNLEETTKKFNEESEKFNAQTTARLNVIDQRIHNLKDYEDCPD